MTKIEKGIIRPPMIDTSQKIHENVIRKYNGIAENIVTARKTKGMDQTQISEAIGYANIPVIANVESGVKGIDDRAYTLFLLITDSHPEYIIQKKHLDCSELLQAAPDGKVIRSTRINADRMKQEKMAWLLSLSGKTIISSYEKNRRNPSIQNWTMFLLIISQHPYYSLMRLFNQDIFIDQPDWVISASVDADGVVRGHSIKAEQLDRNDVMWNPDSDESIVIDYGYDNRNWQSSAINRDQ